MKYLIMDECDNFRLFEDKEDLHRFFDSLANGGNEWIGDRRITRDDIDDCLVYEVNPTAFHLTLSVKIIME